MHEEGGNSGKAEEGMAVAPLAAVLIEAALKLCSLGDLNVLILVDDNNNNSNASAADGGDAASAAGNDNNKKKPATRRC